MVSFVATILLDEVIIEDSYPALRYYPRSFLRKTRA